MDRRLVTAGAVLIVGGAIGGQMVASSLRRGPDWVVRTGWVGLTVAALLGVAGVYIVLGGRYELAVRVICVGWATVVGGGLAVFTALAVAASGNGPRLLVFGVVTGGLYLAMLVPTGRDVYDWLRANRGNVGVE